MAVEFIFDKLIYTHLPLPPFHFSSTFSPYFSICIIVKFFFLSLVLNSMAFNYLSFSALLLCNDRIKITVELMPKIHQDQSREPFCFILSRFKQHEHRAKEDEERRKKRTGFHQNASVYAAHMIE